ELDQSSRARVSPARRRARRPARRAMTRTPAARRYWPRRGAESSLIHRRFAQSPNQSHCTSKLLRALHIGTQAIELPRKVARARFLTKLKEIEHVQAFEAGSSARFPHSYPQNLWITGSARAAPARHGLCPCRRNSILTRPA